MLRQNYWLQQPKQASSVIDIVKLWSQGSSPFWLGSEDQLLTSGGTGQVFTKLPLKYQGDESDY